MSRIPLNRMKRNGKVDLWDLGPQVPPKPPDAPEAPDKAKFKNLAEFAAVELEYEDALVIYKDKLRAYSLARKQHLNWEIENGGPVKIELWGVDAGHAMEIEPERYRLELPKGLRPGRAQLDAEVRAEREAEELQRAAAMDPQFGAGVTA